MNLKITGMLGALALALISLVQSATAAAPEANYAGVDCWFEKNKSVNAKCGWLQVPENREDSNSDRVVRMPVVILEGAAGLAYGPFAVVLGGGGPGGGLNLDSVEGINYWENYRRKALGGAVNLVLMDQRGAGMSKPLLVCPDSVLMDEEHWSSVLTLEGDIRVIRQESADCVGQFADWGIDLSAYTTAASADDFEDLRHLLRGDGWWDIIGTSYGTQLAFELIRRHPDGVGAVVMNGISPPESSSLLPHDPRASALMKIAVACGKDDFCRTNYGDLRANLESAANLLEQAPAIVVVPHPYQNYSDVAVAINPNRLAGIIFSGIYSEIGVALIPCVAWELSGGQKCQFVSVRSGGQQFGLEYLVSEYMAEKLDSGYADALLNVIYCREYGSMRSNDSAESFPFTLWAEETRRWNSICDDIWAKEGKAPGARDPVSTEKPILMLTGFFDPATPPEWADAATKRLPNARVYQLPASHYGEGQEECHNYLTRQFLRAPFDEIDDSCVQQAEPIPFY